MSLYAPPRLGNAWYDVFKTTPGRIDPRTGLLVQTSSFKAVAPWEGAPQREERGRDRGFRDDDRAYPRLRRDYAETMRGQLSGPGDSAGIFSSAIPLVFLGVAALVVLEATGVTNLSKQKVG